MENSMKIIESVYFLVAAVAGNLSTHICIKNVMVRVRFSISPSHAITAQRFHSLYHRAHAITLPATFSGYDMNFQQSHNVVLWMRAGNSIRITNIE